MTLGPVQVGVSAMHLPLLSTLHHRGAGSGLPVNAHGTANDDPSKESNVAGIGGLMDG